MFFKRGKADEDCVYFGEERVEIPKLTVGKWQLLFENIETLPQLLLNILSARGSDNFTAVLMVGLSVALEEVVSLTSVITGLSEDFIRDNADHNDLIDFIVKTIKKNNLNEAAKKFQAVLSKANQGVEAAAKNQL